MMTRIAEPSWKWLRCQLEIMELHAAPFRTQGKHAVRVRRVRNCGELRAIERGYDLLSMKAQREPMPFCRNEI